MSSGLTHEYAAGFIDGDGSLMIIRNAGRASVYHAPLMTVASTDKGVLEQLKNAFGGSLTARQDPRNPCWKQMWYWTFRIPHDGGILSDLVAHLILKRQQAEACLQMAKRLGYFSGQQRKRLPEDEVARREAICSEVRRLNELRCTCPHGDVKPSVGYLAGFFDAEGCVHVSKHIKGRMSQRIIVNVTNRCKWICEQFAVAFGGSVCRANKNCWQWQCSSRVAQWFLENIKDHLVLKKERALNALDIYSSPRERGGWSYRRGVSVAVSRLVKADADVINRKGVGVQNF